MKNTYSYLGLIPYSAGDMYILDCFVEYGFCGNIPEYIMSNGGVWDSDNKIMTMPGCDITVQYKIS